ncbi:hypothetical protein fugu_009159 [Takifugu bimaculatus]|uniref:N-acetyltransferase domain-containing protein n=1 Tax=Takifugu bimaculatus TaxID=433685 RepID=A0A4Z2AY46_9TELE|nr:hypothetical protein fugu_009159 [Takifugu bimaculatus]
MDVKLRAARKEDCREISRMVMELAVFDKMPDQVKISHEELERDGFCQNPLFECIVAEVPEEHQSRGRVSFLMPHFQSTDLCSTLSSAVSLSGFAVVGYALYFYTYSTWKGPSAYLEDLYVMPEFRGKGIGKGLLSKVAEVVKKKGCARLQLSVLEWNTNAQNLYTSKGAQDLTVSEGWHAMRFEGQHLDNLAGEAPKE